MTKDEFESFWQENYPKTKPIPYLFKHDYGHRWFRIHSLPQSKRYAQNEAEWKILLNQQNQIMTALLGDRAPVLLVTGEFAWDGETADTAEQAEALRDFDFTKADPIDLHALNPDDYDANQFYIPAFAQTTWRPGAFDALLREIALDNIWAFFVSPAQNTIAAPYDGGMDLILPDTESRDICKAKYKD